MSTVHLVFPHGSALRSPHVVGRTLAETIGKRYDVALYDWDEPVRIRPAVGDLLLGHPHPAPWTSFRRSMRDPRFARVVTLFPFNADIGQNAYADSAVRQSDLFLAITGNFWFDSVESSPFAHWRPKMVHVDLAVDRSLYPVVKRSFNAPGERRILYVGHSGWQKNPAYLSALAARRPDWRWTWVGSGKRPIAGFEARGTLDFSTADARRLVAEHDFLVTVGRFDSNPTTILEAMAWGLVPVCTPQSGYAGFRGIPNVPLDDVEGAIAVLDDLQIAPTAELDQRQHDNWSLLDTHFNWGRFGDQVLLALEGAESPACLSVTPARSLRLRLAAGLGPYSPVRPLNARRAAGAAVRRVRARPTDRTVPSSRREVAA